MSDMMSNRRKAPRYPIILPAEVVTLSDGTRLTARTSDLSRTGCYVDTLNPLPSGFAIRINLVRGVERFEVQGTVKYVSPGMGMGIQFEEQIPASQLAILDSWLEAAAKQPA